jgi:protein-tyrosine phosphatase
VGLSVKIWSLLIKMFSDAMPEIIGLREALVQITRLKPADGGMALGPRPGKKSKAAMAQMGLTHVCTLLNGEEDAEAIRRIALELDCGWVWLPVAGGNLEKLEAADTEAMVVQLAETIAQVTEPRVYVHCSAGIHRTGFFASMLLRLQPLDVDDIPGALAKLRPVTAQSVGQDRIALAVARANALMERA